MAKKAKKNNHEALKNAAFAAVALLVSYGLASLAIDSGSLWHYAFTFVAVYFAGHFIKLLIVGQFFHNEKSTKARRAKK